MSSEDPKPFERPWFIVNCVALCIGIFTMLFHHGTAIFGISMLSIAAQAIYSGHFSLRNADYSIEDEPGSFWLCVIFYGAIGLFCCLLSRL